MLPERLSQHIWDLEHLGCKVLVLCPTTEQTLFQSVGAQPSQPIAGQTGLHAQTAPRAVGSGSTRANRATNPASRCRAARRECFASTTTRPTCCWCKPCSKTWAPRSSPSKVVMPQSSGTDRTLRPGTDGRADAGHGRPSEHRNHPPVGKRAALHAAADRRPHRPRHGQRKTCVAAERHGRLPDQTDQRTATGAGGAEVDRAGAAQSGAGAGTARARQGGNNCRYSITRKVCAWLRAKPIWRRTCWRCCWPRWRPTAKPSAMPATATTNALIERVHRLHGATRYCGVPQLRAACQRSETLLKQDDAKASASPR